MFHMRRDHPSHFAVDIRELAGMIDVEIFAVRRAGGCTLLQRGDDGNVEDDENGEDDGNGDDD